MGLGPERNVIKSGFVPAYDPNFRADPGWRDKPSTIHRADGPWARAAACSAMGPRQFNEDYHVLCCKGLAPEVSAKKQETAAGGGGGGLFDDLPSEVAGPSLPSVESDNVDCLFAVFDGHGGSSVSKLCSERLPAELREQLEAAGRDTAESRLAAAEETCLALDRHIR